MAGAFVLVSGAIMVFGRFSLGLGGCGFEEVGLVER